MNTRSTSRIKLSRRINREDKTVENTTKYISMVMQTFLLLGTIFAIIGVFVLTSFYMNLGIPINWSLESIQVIGITAFLLSSAILAYILLPIAFHDNNAMKYYLSKPRVLRSIFALYIIPVIITTFITCFAASSAYEATYPAIGSTTIILFFTAMMYQLMGKSIGDPPKFSELFEAIFTFLIYNTITVLYVLMFVLYINNLLELEIKEYFEYLILISIVLIAILTLGSLGIMAMRQRKPQKFIIILFISISMLMIICCSQYFGRLALVTLGSGGGIMREFSFLDEGISVISKGRFKLLGVEKNNTPENRIISLCLWASNNEVWYVSKPEPGPEQQKKVCHMKKELKYQKNITSISKKYLELF